MKLLVTGGAGYIGSVTTKRLIDEGHDVAVFDSLELGHKKAVDPRADFYQGDLRNAAEISQAIATVKPSGVVHFAAYAAVGESMEDPQKYFANNVLGGVNLLSAMLEQDVKRIVFSSTCATYGQPDLVPITEDETQSPENPYGESKLMFEKILIWHQQLSGLEPVMLRYFNACGASGPFGEDHDPEYHIIPLVLQVALGQREKIFINGDDYDTPDGTCIRDYIHIEDLAQAHSLALTSGHTGAFNLGNGNGSSVKEVIQACREVTGQDIPAEIRERRPGDPPRLVAAADKARTLLGWKPDYPELRDIIQTAWDWHRAHPNGYGE